jgi:hypothetical protein
MVSLWLSAAQRAVGWCWARRRRMGEGHAAGAATGGKRGTGVLWKAGRGNCKRWQMYQDFTR